jgi:hypothetical protein
MSWIGLLAYQISLRHTNARLPITLAPGKEHLALFGGELSITEFRKNFTTIERYEHTTLASRYNYIVSKPLIGNQMSTSSHASEDIPKPLKRHTMIRYRKL